MIEVKIYRSDTERKWIVEEKNGDKTSEYRSSSRIKALVSLFMRHPGLTLFYLRFPNNKRGESE